MTEIIFIYNGYEVSIQCSPGEKMRNIMERLCIKLNVAKNEIYALYDGKVLDEELNADQLKKNENNKTIIIVYKYSDTVINDKILKSTNEIICPICKTSCLMEIKDYQISLYNCQNEHRTNLPFNAYNETQKINLTDIICNICKERNKGNTHNNEFYKCLDCKLNICPLCKSNHNNNHKIINYDQINFICNEHAEPYFSFCFQCRKNICISCENKHIDHYMLSYGKFLKDINEIIKNNIILRNDIDNLKDISKGIIKKLNMVIENLEIYY